MMWLVGLSVAVLWSGSVVVASLASKAVMMEDNTLQTQFDLSHLGQDCGLRGPLWLRSRVENTRRS